MLANNSNHCTFCTNGASIQTRNTWEKIAVAEWAGVEPSCWWRCASKCCRFITILHVTFLALLLSYAPTSFVSWSAHVQDCIVGHCVMTGHCSYEVGFCCKDCVHSVMLKCTDACHRTYYSAVVIVFSHVLTSWFISSMYYLCGSRSLSSVLGHDLQQIVAKFLSLA